MNNGNLKISNVDHEISRIQNFIQNRLSESPTEEAIIGLSGGIDSATVLSLAATGLSSEAVRGVFLPENSTPQQDCTDARKIAEEVGCNFIEYTIDDPIEAIVDQLRECNQLTLANIKARVRMTVLYSLANLHDGLVIGTGNRSEWLLGYFTKYGDGASDIAPILHLYKTEINQLARRLEIPTSVRDKPPSAGLWKGQTDAEELGASYDRLDKILVGLYDLKLNPDQVQEKFHVEPSLVSRVQSMVNGSEHKRRSAPSLNRNDSRPPGKV